MEEYFILLGKSIYGSVDTAILWLRLLYEYLINGFNLKRSKACYWIFYKKCDNRKLELVMSVHVDNVFVAGHPGKSEKIK